VISAIAGFRKIATASGDALTKTRNADIANAARAILAEYGVGTRGKNPREYMEAAKAYDPELYAARYLKRYRDLLKSIEPTLKPGRIDAPSFSPTSCATFANSVPRMFACMLK